MERVSRKDDENLYQPKIHATWIRALYRMSRVTGLPMTVLVNEALRLYCQADGPALAQDVSPDMGNAHANGQHNSDMGVVVGRTTA